MAAVHVLLIEPENSSAAFMRHMLSRAGYEVEYAPSGKEGLIAAWRDQPDIIVLELDLPDIDGLEVVQKLRADNRTQGKQIFALTRRSGAEETERAIDAGVDHYIVKQTDAVDMLLRTLGEEALDDSGAGERPRPSRPGRVLAFLSAKGGVGTSSLAANIAHHIGEDEEHSSVLVDLVLPLGSLAHYVGGSNKVDIVQLTTRLKPNELTRSYLRSNLASPRSWSFQFVGGAKDPAAGAELDADRLAPVLQSLRAGYDRVTVDLGRTLSPITMLVLRQADVIALVFAPEAASVAGTKAVLRYLKGQGIPAERFFLLANRPLGTEDMPTDDVKAALERPIDLLIPHMGPNLSLTNRLSVPLALRFPEEGGTERVGSAASEMLKRQAELARSESS